MLIRLSSLERVEISPPAASKVEHKDKIRLTTYKNRVPQSGHTAIILKRLMSDDLQRFLTNFKDCTFRIQLIVPAIWR